MARVHSVGGTRVTPLAEKWDVAAAPAGSIADPTALAAAKLDWCPAIAPCTAASALRSAKRWSLDERVDFDAQDWWWRTTFEISDDSAQAVRLLRFHGLATIAEVWLDGQRILEADDMFVAYDVDVGPWLQPKNELVLVCRSLGQALKARRPRPRWRTRLVDAQQLRWFRTTLSGRIPAWSPPAAPVGPWRPIVLEERFDLSVRRADVRSRLEGANGIVELELEFDAVRGPLPESVTLYVGDLGTPLRVEPREGGGGIVRGAARVERPERWWPHTHGTPARHRLRVEVPVKAASSIIDLGSVAFRAIELTSDDGAFALRVNGVDIFCRGACWTPVDAAALLGASATYRAALDAVRAAGMNMLRIGGTFYYEDDAFYEACDDLGILVWQDYPFANMDYPGEDPGFVATVEREVRGFLDRTQLAGCLAVLCGNSEIEQQAAMMGAPRDIWRSPLFERTLPALGRELRPDVPYWPSTPSGGALPFLTDVGTAHYFGVGAYLRPLEDARRAGVRFATECLAFANVPDQGVIDELLKNGGTPPQDPRWKERTPRDGSAGWDFEDVRDHYLHVLFGVDPLALRYADVPRYLALSRVVTGEVMAATFGEWRRRGSGCAGALIWFLRDLWPGAGWGVLGADLEPKAAYFYLRRVLQPLALLLVDEGLNGLDVHVVNDEPRPYDLELDVVLLRDGEVPIASVKAPVHVSPHDSLRLRLADLLDRFVDTTFSYRFGPRSHEVAVATVVDPATGAVRGRAFHFPGGLPAAQEADLGLQAIARPAEEGTWTLAVSARKFAQSVMLEVPGFTPDDNYFHLAPGPAHEVRLRPNGRVPVPRGTAQALNGRVVAKLVVATSPPPQADAGR